MFDASAHKSEKPDIWISDQWPTSSRTETWRAELVLHWLWGRVQAMGEAFLETFFGSKFYSSGIS